MSQGDHELLDLLGAFEDVVTATGLRNCVLAAN
jgi:hypothetical protein